MATEDAWDGSYRDEIQCPHCGALDEEFTDYPHSLQHDGDHAEIECWSCGKPMGVTLCASYTFATEPIAAAPSPGKDGGAEPGPRTPCATPTLRAPGLNGDESAYDHDAPEFCICGVRMDLHPSPGGGNTSWW